MKIKLSFGSRKIKCNIPVDTRRRLNVYKTSIRRRRRRIDDL